jgi:hypothetical protein
VAALACLDVALVPGRGHYHPLALPPALGALALLLVELRGRDEPRTRATASWVVAAPFALGLVGLALHRPGGNVPREAPLGWLYAGVAAAALIGVSYLWPAAALRHLRFPALAAIYLGLGAWIIRAVPVPAIDVWVFQQEAVARLLAGINPWDAFYPNIYGTTATYPDVYLKDGRIHSFIYPPAVVLLGLPGYLLGGDVRLSLLLAVAGAGVFALAMGRRIGLPAGHPAELVAAAILFHPRALFLIEQAWVDPYLACAGAAALWALASGRARAARFAVSVFIGAKQYGALWLVALWEGRRFGLRDTAWTLALAGLVVLPFFVWAPDGVVRGVVLVPLLNPFRLDALSVPAAVAHWTGVQLPAALAWLATAAVVLFALRRGRGHVGGEARLGAAIYLTFFLLNKQAFFSYYWLVGALLCLATIEALALTEVGPTLRRDALTRRPERPYVRASRSEGRTT